MQELELEGGSTERVVVEVDGRSKFTLNKPHLPLGHLRLRRRLLGARGWRVVSVPFFEWEHVGQDHVGQEEYLRDKLAATARPL